MLHIDTLTEQATQVFWPMLRISGVMMIAPVFSHQTIPRKIKLLFALMLGIIVSNLIPETASSSMITSYGFILVIKEILIGLIMGFAFQIIFHAFVIGGQVIAMQTGLGFATMIDPGNNANVPLISQLYMILVTLVFLALDGHLLIIKLLVDSYQIISIDHLMQLSSIKELLAFSAWMFNSAIIISLPAIVSLLVVNITFGIMTRATPQFNIFVVGFPITLILGVIIIFITANSLLPHVSEGLLAASDLIKQAIR